MLIDQSIVLAALRTRILAPLLYAKPFCMPPWILVTRKKKQKRLWVAFYSREGGQEKKEPQRLCNRDKEESLCKQQANLTGPADCFRLSTQARMTKKEKANGFQ